MDWKRTYICIMNSHTYSKKSTVKKTNKVNLRFSLDASFYNVVTNFHINFKYKSHEQKSSSTTPKKYYWKTV